MNSTVNNIFGIENPQNYQCALWGYRVGHSLIVLQASLPHVKADKPFYLLFETALYFEGPIRWMGADFHIGTLDENKEMLSLLHQGKFGLPDDAVDVFLEKFHLFSLNSSIFRVRIFAENAYITTGEPQISYTFPEVEMKMIHFGG